MNQNKIKKIYLLSFFLPIACACLICLFKDVYPFGDKCILHVDMYHQYAPFFTEFMNKLKHGGSLFYSWNIGLGSDFIALLAYYLASPLNWLLIFCPSEYVIEFMTLLIILKIGFCGLSFSFYLQKHFQTSDFAAAVFALFYALSGYMAAYSWDIMWLDVVALAPIVIFGLEQLVKEKKCALYCLTLALSILSNFYLAIMLCIFLVLYFGILLFEEVKTAGERLGTFVRFTIYSLLAGGMGAILLFPEALILSYSGSAGMNFPKVSETYFSLLEELARHCAGVTPYTGREHFPNLYCGAAVLLFLILYLLNRNISLKKKGTRVALIVFFWISFANNYLDFIWHGLHFPDSLPARQAFLYIFLLLVMSYEAYEKREGNKAVDVLIAIVASGGFLALLYFLPQGQAGYDSLLLTAVLTTGYGIFYAISYFGKKEWKRMIKALALTLAVTEAFVNFHMTGFSTTSRSAYTKNWESVKTLLAETRQMDSDAFYRVEETERLTKNDAMLYGYSSSTLFSSLMNIGVANFYKKMGMEGGKNFYSYSGSTPLSSAMLSVKYLISGSPYEESPLRTLVAEDGTNYIYQNVYTLPIGFTVESDFEEKWSPIKGRAVANLNKMAHLLGAENELLIPFSKGAEAQEDKTIIKVPEDMYLYASYTDTSVTNLTVTCGERVRKFNKCDHGYLLDLGWFHAGDVVEITNSSDVSYFEVQPYRLNFQALSESYQTLNEQTFQTDVFSDTKIEGHIDIQKEGELVFSIPKEDGWRVFVDGKETESEFFMESFTAIPLEKGRHEIKLVYKTPRFLEGAAVSVISFLLFAVLQMWERKKFEKEKRSEKSRVEK